MPTGLTADIEKGITFPQFVWTCARQFGAFVTMRDEPHNAKAPERFEPSDYHANKIAELTAERDRIVSMTNAQADEAASAVNAEETTRYNGYIAERRALRAKYEAMLVQAKAWSPPSPDHEGLKTLMVEQLQQSIEFDCDERYVTKPANLDGSKWRRDRLTKIDRDLQYHHDENAKEVARTEQRNAWIAGLRASVPMPK